MPIVETASNKDVIDERILNVWTPVMIMAMHRWVGRRRKCLLRRKRKRLR